MSSPSKRAEPQPPDSPREKAEPSQVPVPQRSASDQVSTLDLSEREIVARSVSPPKQSPEHKPNNSFGWLALGFALLERGLDVIGFHNLVVGGLLFSGAFIAGVLWFIRWETARRWRFSKRALAIVLAALVYFPLVGYQLYAKYTQEVPSPTDQNKAVVEKGLPFREKIPEQIAFNLGGNLVRIPRALLEKEAQPIHVDEFNPISVAFKNGAPYVNVTLWNGYSADINDAEVVLVENEFVQPNRGGHGGDINYNDRAFELVDEGRMPLLQVYYKTSYEVVINGRFRSPYGMIFVSDSGNGIQRQPEEVPPPLKRIFKYPSIKYRGEFNPEWKSKPYEP